MTNKEAIIEHLVWMASDQPNRPGDKAYAWSSAKHIAKLLKEWEDIPELLTAEMQRLKNGSTA